MASCSGAPSNRRVLFLHGAGQTRHSWERSARTMATRGWYTIALDIRGHGDSDWAASTDGYTQASFVGDIEAVVEQMGPPVAVVGASMGGLIALQAVARGGLPIVSALVLVDIAPRVEPRGADRVLSFMGAHPEGFASVEEAQEVLAAYDPRRGTQAGSRRIERNLRGAPDGRYRWHWDPKILLAFAGADLEEHGREMLAAARRLTIPALVVRGEHSDVLSVAGAAEFAAAVPGARYVDISGAGHMVVGDQNDPFTECVIQFLEGV